MQFGKKSIARLVALASSCAVFACAYGDVKVTAEVTVTGIGDQPKTETVTTCYKGHLIRTEREGTVSVYDTSKQTVTTFRKADKTYRVLDLKDNLTKMPSAVAKLKISTSAAIQPVEGSTTIAGLPSKKYVGEATIKIAPEGQQVANVPTTHIQIEQWMTEAVRTANGDDAQMPLEQLLGPLKIYGSIEPLMKEFSKMKGLPLSSKVTVRIENGNMKNPIVTTTNVKSVSEAPLEDSLFQVPKGYTQAQIRRPQRLDRRQQP